MNRILFIVSLLVCASLLLVVSFFTYHWGFNLSDDMAAWGQTGDFFGGILNPVFALLNLFALLYLTKIVQESEKARTEENIKMSFMPVAVVTAYDFEDCTHIQLLNCGTGPLFLTDVNAIKNDLRAKNLVSHMPELPEEMKWSNFLLSHDDIAVAPGDSIDLIKIDYPDESIQTNDIRHQIRLALAESTLEISYCGISKKFPQTMSKRFTNFNRHRL